MSAAAVVPPKPIPNIKPIANAGLDKTVYTRAPVELNGWASKDPDGEIAKWRWVQTLGPRVKLLGANTPTPSFVAPIIANPKAKPQKMVFALFVTDNPPKKPKQIVIAKTAMDTIAVTVKPNSAFTVTGRVIDGYLNGAHVFWDCNGDWMPNSSENASVSGKKGVYIINQAPDPAKCDLRAYVPAGAIDEDTGKPVMDSFTMSSLPDNPNLITPLTTLANADTLIVNAKAKALAITSNAGAGKTTAEQLGVPTNTDYITCSDKIVCPNTHNAAKLTTLAIQNQKFSYLAPENIPEALRNTTTVVASEQTSYMTGKDLTPTQVKNITVDWVNFSYASLFEKSEPIQFIADPSATFASANWDAAGTSVILEHPYKLDDKRVSFLQEVLKIAYDKKIVSGGVIHWNQLDKATRDQLNRDTKVNLGETKETLTIIEARKSALDQLGIQLETTTHDTVWNATVKSPDTFKFGVQVLLRGGQAGLGILKFSTTVNPVTKGLSFNGVRYKGKLESVKKLSERLKKLTECGLFADSFISLMQIDEPASDDVYDMFNGFGKCVSALGKFDAFSQVLTVADSTNPFSQQELVKTFVNALDFVNSLAEQDLYSGP